MSEPSLIIDDFVKNINSNNKENGITEDNYTSLNDIFNGYQKISNDVKKEFNNTESMKQLLEEYKNIHLLLVQDINKLINIYHNSENNSNNELLRDIKTRCSSLYKKNNAVMNYNYLKDDNLQELFNIMTSKIIELSQIQYTKGVVVIGIYDESFKNGSKPLKLDEAINLLTTINQKNKSDVEKTIVYIQPNNENVVIESNNNLMFNGIDTNIIKGINTFSNL
jgi:hypothetical protein